MSIPNIIVILGAISNLATEFVVPGTCHFILLKSDIPSQVSSIFKKTFFFLAYSRNSIAHRYRSTKFFSELEWSATVLIFLYFIPISFFMTCETTLSFTYIPEVFSINFLIYSDESMTVRLAFRSWTVSLISTLICYFISCLSISSDIMLGFLLVFRMSYATTLGLTLYSFAISACFSC